MCFALRAPQKRLNLTKTVRKQSINENLGKVGAATEDKKMHDPKYDKDHPVRRRPPHAPPFLLLPPQNVVDARSMRGG